ncbi:MAG: hypothetical protein EOO73_31080 [Myxococcales bacterium]|nr:MAG: hypothetical protein EOO73_31080 [Myxococcales bacterium]
MLRHVDVTFLDDAEEPPAELLRALPEIRHELTPAPADDDLGLRSLLEHPELFTHDWWRAQASRSTARPRPRRPTPHRAA